MKEKNRTLANEWFDRASSDLQYAKAGEKETGQHHITCFLCHQSVEKLLKGLIVLNGESPPKTHNLTILFSKPVIFLKILEKLQTDIRKLDKFYIPARYPGNDYSEFSEKDAQQALATTRQVMEALNPFFNHS